MKNEINRKFLSPERINRGSLEVDRGGGWAGITSPGGPDSTVLWLSCILWLPLPPLPDTPLWLLSPPHVTRVRIPLRPWTHCIPPLMLVRVY